MTREERRRKERWLRRYRDGLAEERRLRGEMREVRERLASTSAALGCWKSVRNTCRWRTGVLWMWP